MRGGVMIDFEAPPAPDYAGGCSTEPALFALNHLVTWRGAVTVNGQRHADVAVLPFLKGLIDAPEAYGLQPAEAQEAAWRFVDLAAPLLEREGGRREWLEREFA